MTKRILFFSTLTLFVLFCSVLGAEQKSDADKNASQPNIWTQILQSGPSGIKAEDRLEKHATPPRQGEEGRALSPGSFPWAAKPAGPLDFCPFTAACFDGSLGNPCDAVGFPGGELCEYQDPAVTCPPGCPTYPFLVRSVHIFLSNCDPVNGCVALVTPGIREVIFPTPGCAAPGNIICSGPTVEIFLPPGTLCQEFVIPLDPNCCVNGPYFACLDIRYLAGPCQQISPCHDLSCNPCCSYWDQLGGSFLDMCGVGFPGNFTIWTDGFLSCQNNCQPPQCSDGLDNDGDGLVDFPADCGCTDPSDPTEAPNPPTQCSDGVDNDGDGLIDWPNDPGCADMCDNDEFNPPPALRNHYKTWRIFDLAAPVPRTVQVVDQFMTDVIQLDSLHYLSNPAQKDGEPIIDPDAHLTWYRATGQNFPREIQFRNQFGLDTVRIDTLDYLLVPTQKFPHPPPIGVDHYKAYRIRNPQPFNRPTNMLDQFLPEFVNSLVPRYLLTPTRKNAEPVFDLTTHYVAYEFFPKRVFPDIRQTQDQFGPHNIRIDSSMFLLVPTDKTFVCPCAKGDINCSGTFSPADVVCLLNCVFQGAANLPCVCDFCVADVNCSGNLSPADVVLELNRVFNLSTVSPWCGS